MVGIERRYSPEQLGVKLKDLVSRSLNPNGKVARRARAELYKDLAAQPTHDATFAAISIYQAEVIAAKNPDTIRGSFEIMDDLIDRTILPSEGRDSVVLVVKRDSRSAVHTIITQDERLRNMRHVQRYIHPPYTELTQRLAPQLAQRLDEGNPQVALEYTSSRGNISAAPAVIPRPQISREDAKRIASDAELSRASGGKAETTTDKIYNAWFEELKRIAADTKGRHDWQRIDEELTHFRQQPVDLTTDYLYEKAVAGVSLADIESMPYPLSPYDTRRITRYLTELQKANFNDYGLLQAMTEEAITTHVDLYEDDYQPRPLTNWVLLRNIDSWRQHFWYSFLLAPDQRVREGAEELFRSLDRRNRMFLTMRFLGVANPRGELNTPDVYQYNPFFLHAVKQFRDRHSRFVNEYFVHEDDLWEQAYRGEYLPQLERRLTEVGLIDEEGPVINSFKDYEVALTNPELRLTRIGRLYEEDISGNFIGEVNRRAKSLTEETQGIWDDTLTKGLHILPLHEGVEVVHFTRHSTAQRLGVARLYINRDSPEDQWGLNVRFDFIDPRRTCNPLYVVGKIEHDGTFSLTTPIEQGMPGIKAVLGRMAVLAFKDITYLRAKEGTIEGKRPPFTMLDEDDQQQTAEPRRSDKEGKIRYTQIPRARTPVRRHTETMIRESVTPKVRFDPRRIGTHSMNLPGISDYERALENYRTIEDPEALEQARKRLHKPNPRKLEIWPEDVMQTVYTDPVTGEPVYGNTWVAEYTKPKLTPDQELEIVLWQRNYKSLNTSTTALATLDEFKSWL